MYFFNVYSFQGRKGAKIKTLKKKHKIQEEKFMNTHAPTIIERLIGYMQIAVSYILTAVMMLLPAQPGNFTFSVSEPVTTESKVIIVEYKNETRRTVTAADDFDFVLEEKSDNEWVKIPFSEDYYRIEMETIIMPTLGNKMTINLENAFGHTLEKGDYRLTFTYYVQTSYGAGQALTANTTFTVS